MMARAMREPQGSMKTGAMTKYREASNIPIGRISHTCWRERTRMQFNAALSRHLIVANFLLATLEMKHGLG